jgi:predicted neuraminidase
MIRTKAYFKARGLRFLVLVLAGSLWGIGWGHANEIAIERVIGPEFPGKYKHPASIAELDNGDLYIAYYGGDGEYAEKTAVYGMRKTKGGTRWSQPMVIADFPWHSEGNAVVWQAPDHLVWLIYVCREGETWSTSRIFAKISHDGAHTWSDPFLVAPELGMMARGRPIVLADGDYLLPVYHEKGNDRELTTPDTTSLFLRFNPTSKTWSESNRITSRLGNEQPAPAVITDTHLVAYCRRGGDYEPRDDGYMVRSESFDGGRTWSAGTDSPFPNPNSAVDFLRLKSGNLLLLYNHSMSERTPLTAALSVDQDQSYPHRRDIIAGDGDYAYPFAIQDQAGQIQMVFTSHERTVINLAVFREEDIIGHKDH